MPRESNKKRMMTPDPAAPDATRRRLLGGGALMVAASAAAVARPGAEASAPDPEPQDRRKLTYRETDHIAAYYSRARG